MRAQIPPPLLLVSLVLLQPLVSVAAAPSQSVVIVISSDGVASIYIVANVSKGVTNLTAPCEPVPATIMASLSGARIPIVYDNGSFIIVADRAGIVDISYIANVTVTPSGVYVLEVNATSYTLKVEPGVVLLSLPSSIVSANVEDDKLVIVAGGYNRIEYVVVSPSTPTTTTTVSKPQRTATTTTAATAATATKKTVSYKTQSTTVTTTTTAVATQTQTVAIQTSPTTTRPALRKPATETTSPVVLPANTTASATPTSATPQTPTTTYATRSVEVTKPTPTTRPSTSTLTPSPTAATVSQQTTTRAESRSVGSKTAVAAIALIAVLTALAALRRGGGGRGSNTSGTGGGPPPSAGSAAVKPGENEVEPVFVELDSTDKLILDKLKGAGGEMYQSQLQKATGLPKTTLWRHVKRLAELGYVKIVREGKYNKVILLKEP